MRGLAYLRTLRFKLTVTYLLVFGLVFGLVGVVGLGFARTSVQRKLDSELEDRARQMVAALVQSGDPFTAESLSAAAVAESRTLYFRGFHVQLRSEAGDTLARSEGLGGRDLPLVEGVEGVEGVEAWEEDEPTLATVGVAWTPGEVEEPYRVASVYHASPGVLPFVVQVGSDLGPVREPVAFLNRLAWVGLVLALCAAAVASWLAAGRAMSRLGQIADAVRAVGLDDLGETPIVPPTPDPEVAQLADDLNVLLARVAEGLRARERFIQDVSHELKTPLSVLSSEAQVVTIRQDLSDDAREFAASVGEEARHLGRLVESMLALARAEATGDMAQAAESSAYDAVVAAVSGCQPAARESGVTIEITLGDGDPDADEDALFFGDPALVTAMVSNLVRNAVSFSPKDDPVVQVSAAHAAGRITIAVEDRGPGIPPEAIGGIFDRFAQARPRDSVRGHGLGLSIARTVAELHEGGLSVENLSPVGCRFTVTIKAIDPDATQDAAS